jgi:hypothetical protein
VELQTVAVVPAAYIMCMAVTAVHIILDGTAYTAQQQQLQLMLSYSILLTAMAEPMRAASALLCSCFPARLRAAGVVLPKMLPVSLPL